MRCIKASARWSTRSKLLDMSVAMEMTQIGKTLGWNDLNAVNYF